MKVVKSEQNYIVECEESEWYDVPPDSRDTLLEGFRHSAGSQNCTSITVFVNPDPILPVHGIDRRTRVHSEKLDSGKLFETSLTYHAELAPAAWDAMSQVEKDAVLREVREGFAKRGHRNPGRYEVFVTRPAGIKGVPDRREYVERGRV